MEIQIAVAKINKYAVSESGDTLEVIERPTGGLSVVLADGQTSGRGAKAISMMVVRKVISLIAEGVVKLNGVKVTTPATLVTPRDIVSVRGKKIADPERLRVFRFHKPVGLVTTARDEMDRPTVFAGLPAELPRLISIGRLDLNSEGLLLLTTSPAS